MKMLKTPVIALLAATLLVPASASAATPNSAIDADRPEKEQMSLLLMMLGAHEYTPKAKVLARIGTERNVSRLLIQIADYRRYRPTIRTRALATLYLLPTKDVKMYLVSVVHERDNARNKMGTLLRKQALRSLGRGFGKTAVAELVAVRTDTNAQIREAVAHALGDTKAQEALPHLRAWLPNETELFVRLAIDRAIDALRKR